MKNSNDEIKKRVIEAITNNLSLNPSKWMGKK